MRRARPPKSLPRRVAQTYCGRRTRTTSAASRSRPGLHLSIRRAKDIAPPSDARAVCPHDSAVERDGQWDGIVGSPESASAQTSRSSNRTIDLPKWTTSPSRRSHRRRHGGHVMACKNPTACSERSLGSPRARRTRCRRRVGFDGEFIRASRSAGASGPGCTCACPRRPPGRRRRHYGHSASSSNGLAG